MGQVPCAKTWLLVGDGQLATHLAVYFDHLGIPFRQWSRRVGWCPRGPALTAEHSVDFARFERVLVALRDDALAPFVHQHRIDPHQPWVHFSGSQQVEGASTAHPLCTFGPAPYTPEVYATIPFVTEAGAPPLAALLPGLANPTVAIPADDKPLYHALCVMAGNFTNLLWQHFFHQIEQRWNMPATTALPYLERTTANLVNAHRAASLTGPLARGDVRTINGNLAALETGALPADAALYRAFLDWLPTAGLAVAA